VSLVAIPTASQHYNPSVARLGKAATAEALHCGDTAEFDSKQVQPRVARAVDRCRQLSLANFGARPREATLSAWRIADSLQHQTVLRRASLTLVDTSPDHNHISPPAESAPLYPKTSLLLLTPPTNAPATRFHFAWSPSHLRLLSCLNDRRQITSTFSNLANSDQIPVMTLSFQGTPKCRGCSRAYHRSRTTSEQSYSGPKADQLRSPLPGLEQKPRVSCAGERTRSRSINKSPVKPKAPSASAWIRHVVVSSRMHVLNASSTSAQR
jgi:hypothetical protein